jgi:hypothetical protein
MFYTELIKSTSYLDKSRSTCTMLPVTCRTTWEHGPGLAHGWHNAVRRLFSRRCAMCGPHKCERGARPGTPRSQRSYLQLDHLADTEHLGQVRQGGLDATVRWHILRPARRRTTRLTAPPISRFGRGFCSLLALVPVPEQLAGLAVDEMQLRARGAGDTLVKRTLFFLPLARRPQGLHVEARGGAAEYDQSVHGLTLEPVRSRALMQVKSWPT